MSYSIRVTPNAVEQIGMIVEYISDTLQVPETALRWSDFLKKEISKLAEMPGRYRLVEDAPWHSLGIHVFPVKNFVVYFWINEAESTVCVTAVVYQRRDQLGALIDMPLDVM